MKVVLAMLFAPLFFVLFQFLVGLGVWLLLLFFERGPR